MCSDSPLPRVHRGRISLRALTPTKPCLQHTRTWFHCVQLRSMSTGRASPMIDAAELIAASETERRTMLEVRFSSLRCQLGSQILALLLHALERCEPAASSAAACRHTATTDRLSFRSTRHCQATVWIGNRKGNFQLAGNDTETLSTASSIIVCRYETRSACRFRSQSRFTCNRRKFSVPV